MISLGCRGNQEPSIAFPRPPIMPSPRSEIYLWTVKINCSIMQKRLQCSNAKVMGAKRLPDYPITSLSVLWLSWHFFYKANDVCRKKNLKISRKCKSLYEAVTFIITDNNWWFMRCHHSNQLLRHPLVPLTQWLGLLWKSFQREAQEVLEPLSPWDWQMFEGFLQSSYVWRDWGPFCKSNVKRYWDRVTSI